MGILIKEIMDRTIVIIMEIIKVMQMGMLMEQILEMETVMIMVII